MLRRLRNIRFIYFNYTKLAGLIVAGRFRRVKSLVLFLGYPRSGSSTLGSILDAHRNALFAHELNALKYVQEGYGYKQLFFMLAKNSGLFTKAGRVSSGYKGIIGGQYNGKANPCYIIGDKKAGKTSFLLQQDQSLGKKLLYLYPSVKLIHIVRNPFDMVATQAYQGNDNQVEATMPKLDAAIDLFSAKFETVNRLLGQGNFEIFTVRHEKLLTQTIDELTRLISWLGLVIYPGYLEDISNHLFDAPHKSRYKVNWLPEQKERVESLILKYSFLGGYTFEN